MSNYYHDPINDLVKSELHHICTTLEIDPIDEAIVDGKFTLVFGHHKVALKVARLAAVALNNSKPCLSLWKPSVIVNGHKCHASVWLS